MSQAQYSIYLSDHTGMAFRENITGQVISVDATRVVNGVGSCVLTMSSDLLPESFFARDARVAIYRALPGRVPMLLFNTVYLLRKYSNKYEGAGRIRTLQCYDINTLLSRRRIAYYATSAQAKKASIAIDDLMKEFVNENMGASATDVTRRLNSYISITGDLSAAPVIDKAASWRPLLQLLQELAQESAQLGTYLAFDLYAQDERTFAFSTFTGQRGYDRRYGTSNQFVLSIQRGNFDNVRVDIDWSNEITRVYAGAQGVDTERNVQSATDIARAGASIFGLIEDFSDVRHVSQSDTTSASNEANSRLRESKPRIIVAGSIIETDGAIYDMNYSWGDYVTMNVDYLQADCRLDVVRAQIGATNGGFSESFSAAAQFEDEL
jgi:hypothetical protein